jgi:hypothetical protein
MLYSIFRLESRVLGELGEPRTTQGSGFFDRL